MNVYDLTMDYEKDEEYVQGIVFNGTINSEFNFGLDFGINTLKITGFNTIGIILKNMFFANNSFLETYGLFFCKISIFYKNVACAILFQENSSIMFRGNNNSCFFLYFFFTI